MHETIGQPPRRSFLPFLGRFGRGPSTGAVTAARSRLVGEHLEPRMMLAGDVAEWQNPIQPLDVNNDGRLAPIDALMHDEWGGPEGGLLIYSMHAPTGVIFEYYDENLENPWSYSIEDFVNDWKSGAIYGWKSETPKAATG